MDACRIVYSHTLVDAVHPGRTEEACRGMLHLQFEKHCTTRTDSNSVNQGSVGSVFLPTHTTLGNFWLDLYTPPSLGHGGQGATTVLIGNTSAIGGQPATFPTSVVLPGMGFGSSHTLSKCCFNSSTAPLSLQNVGTYCPLQSTWQAVCSLSLLPVQHGWLQFCNIPLSGSFCCSHFPDFHSRDLGSANGAPLVMLGCPYELHNCQEECTGIQCYRGETGVIRIWGSAKTGCSTLDQRLIFRRCLLLSALLYIHFS